MHVTNVTNDQEYLALYQFGGVGVHALPRTKFSQALPLFVSMQCYSFKRAYTAVADPVIFQELLLTQMDERSLQDAFSRFLPLVISWLQTISGETFFLWKSAFKIISL